MAQMINLEAIILAGGFGTRLRPLVSNLPKPLAPINGRPFLFYLLKSLSRQGFTRIILATGYLGEMIENAFGNRFEEMELLYSQESSPLGTGGALARALNIAKQEYVFCINGDTWLDANYRDFYQGASILSIGGIYLEDTRRYGRLILSNNKIIGIEEKTAGVPGWINSGCYLIQRDLFRNIPHEQAFSFERDFLSVYLPRYGASLKRFNGVFIDIGVPQDYMRFMYIVKRIEYK